MSNDVKDEMGNRFKEMEACSTQFLIAGTPKIIRLDGKSFSNYTRNCNRPYDATLMNSITEAVIVVMKEIGGSAKFAYCQSDEISIVINDKQRVESEPWFNNNVNKMISISAAVMSVNFTEQFSKSHTYKPAYFDSRVFQVPSIDEMHNAILWRQFDAIKNSISQYARHYFSDKQVHGKNGKMKIEMMKEKHSFDWNTAPTWTKRGVIVKKGSTGKFEADHEIPEFNVDREYLKKLYIGESSEES